MANIRIFVVLAALGFAACSGPSVTKTTTNPPNPKAAEYNRFVAQRTGELVQSGAVKSVKQAEAQARLEADRRFGPITPEYSTTTTWGSEAKRQKQQNEVTAGLDKMKREQTSPNPGK